MHGKRALAVLETTQDFECIAWNDIFIFGFLSRWSMFYGLQILLKKYSQSDGFVSVQVNLEFIVVNSITIILNHSIGQKSLTKCGHRYTEKMILEKLYKSKNAYVWGYK